MNSRCPKCGGNLRLEKEDTGWELDCLQCGFRFIPGQARPLPHVTDCKLQPNAVETPIEPKSGGKWDRNHLRLKPGAHHKALKPKYKPPQLSRILYTHKKKEAV